MTDKLVNQDIETSSPYIFDSDSSLDHVKIGWTRQSAQGRLAGWSECGYTPNLLFTVDLVPHAQRAETLVHYELIKERRWGRNCQACQRSHIEWFEVSIKRAREVVGDWAKFMKLAEPYDLEGFLKDQWHDFVTETDKRREPVTVKRLLEHYELSRLNELLSEMGVTE